MIKKLRKAVYKNSGSSEVRGLVIKLCDMVLASDPENDDVRCEKILIDAERRSHREEAVRFPHFLQFLRLLRLLRFFQLLQFVRSVRSVRSVPSVRTLKPVGLQQRLTFFLQFMQDRPHAWRIRHIHRAYYFAPLKDRNLQSGDALRGVCFFS